MKKVIAGVVLSSCVAFPVSASAWGIFSQQAEQTQQVEVTQSYEQQAASLIGPLLKATPDLVGDAIGLNFSQIISGEGSDTSKEVQVADGLTATLGGASLAPLGASLVFTMDNYELIPATDNTDPVYATGIVEGGFTYGLVTKKISLSLDSVNDVPVVYNGGNLSGTEVEFDNLTIVVNTNEFIPFWEERVTVEGSITVNGVYVPVEKIVDLLGLISS